MYGGVCAKMKRWTRSTAKSVREGARDCPKKNQRKLLGPAPGALTTCRSSPSSPE